MDYLDAVMAIVYQSQSFEIPIGRTAIQKLVYFASQKGIVEDEDTYFPHYYGPYSKETARALSTAVSIDFVQENSEKFPDFDGKRYVYEVTESGKKLCSALEKEQGEDWGKLGQIVETCRKTANLNMQIMACAAKVHCIIKQENAPMTSDEIRRVASDLRWELTEDDIDRAVDLLVELKLAKRANKET